MPPTAQETAARPAWLVTDFDGYWTAQGYRKGTVFDREDLSDAFDAGMQARRDLAARESQPGRPTTTLEDAMLANIDGLNNLVRDMLQAFPDTADEQEWRDRAGALSVCDPDGQPYRAYTEDDL